MKPNPNPRSRHNVLVGLMHLFALMQRSDAVYRCTGLTTINTLAIMWMYAWFTKLWIDAECDAESWWIAECEL